MRGAAQPRVSRVTRVKNTRILHTAHTAHGPECRPRVNRVKCGVPLRGPAHTFTRVTRPHGLGRVEVRTNVSRPRPEASKKALCVMGTPWLLARLPASVPSARNAHDCWARDHAGETERTNRPAQTPTRQCPAPRAAPRRRTRGPTPPVAARRPSGPSPGILRSPRQADARYRQRSPGPGRMRGARGRSIINHYPGVEP